MSIEVELPDGNTLVFPDGTDKSVIEQTARRAIENPHSLKSTKELEAVPSAPSTFRDINESAAMSLAGGIKGLSDIFGVNNAVSKKMEELQKEAYGRLTPERKRELAIEDELARRASEEGFLAEAKQAGKSFLRSPLQQGVGAAFSSVPIIAATALAPEVTIPAALAGRAGIGALAARTAIANAPAIGVGTAMGVGSQKGQDYAAVKQAMLEKGATEEEAEAAAQKAAEYSLQNLPRQAASGVAGGLEGALGVESLLGRAGRARAGVRGGPEAPTWGQAVGQSTFGEAIPEAIQSGVGAVGSNIAQQQAGLDTDTFKGVAGEMTSGALAAALLGTAVSPLQMRQLRQEFARDQLEKQLEEQKQKFEEYQKKQAEIAKTKENLGTQTTLSLPAPAPKVEEKDPLQNPLGNLTKDELGPEVVGYIEQYRTKNGMPLLNSYSIEDVKDAMTQVNPAGEAAALDSLVAAKSGYQPDVNYSAQDVLNAATNKVDTTTQGFRDFLNRTTGSSDLDTMSQPQLYAAFKALEAVPVGQGLTILPEGSNASRFTEIQMVQGLDAIAAELGKNQALTPEQTITKVKEATGLKNDRDAASLIKQLVKDNNLDTNADGNIIAPTEIKNLPAGYTLEKGTFKQSDQQLYGVLSDGKPLEGVDTYTNPQDAQAKVDALNKTRETQAKAVEQTIKKIQDQIDQSQQNLDAMEAAGEGGTDAYKQAKAQHEAMVSKVTDNINDLQARQMMFQTPLTMGPMGMKQVNRTGFTLFKDGVPVSTHPTADAAIDSLVGTLPDAEVEALAQDKTPGMRTVARKARQRIERQSRPAPTQKKPVAIKEAPAGKVTEEDVKEAQSLAKTLGPILKKFGLGNIELQIIKGMEDEGSYTANLIRIAMGLKDPIGVLYHESIHALKDLGFFTDAQWNALVRMANDKWVDQYLRNVRHDDTRSRFDAYKEQFEDEANKKGLTGKDADNYVQNAIIEEAIADAFRGFGRKPPPGMLTAILNKIKEFFARLKDALNMAGYETAEDIFGRIEQGRLKPAKGDKPNDWKANKADLRKAEEYYDENGIMPYTSEGQLDVPLESDGTKFSIKSPYTEAQAKGRIKKTREGKEVKIAPKFNDPVTGLPLNSNGTVTLYYPTTNEGAREMARVKRLRGHSPEATRIYLTNESSAAEIEKKPGAIDQPVGGANVLLQVDPAWLQVAQEYDNGRKDFYIPIAEGQYFAHKAKMTKMFTLFASRKKGLHPDRKLAEVALAIESTVDAWKAADKKQRDQMFKDAKDVLNQQHNVSNLFGANAKLEKTNIGEYGLTYEGKKVISTGLGFASAQKISDKAQETTCPKSAICEDLCLGETSGQNELYGGEGPHRSGPRLSQFLKTEAFIVNPEAFTTSLIRQIERFRAEAKKVDYYPSIRLNVTSDFPGKMFKPIMDMFPDVKFYDYTKLVTAKPVAGNHHLTYSSTGASQVVKGETIVNKESNWDQLVDKVLPNGMNVAMAFTSRTSMPKAIYDERTDQTFEVWNGDEYDARFLDPKREDGKGWIIGLTNKDRTTAPENAAKERDGFFLDYDPERDGDTLTIKNQNKLAGKPEKKVIPIAKKSLRAPNTKEFKQWFGDSKVVDADGNPLVVYHGTPDFKENEFRPGTRKINRAGNVAGYYFAPDPEEASDYAKTRATGEYEEGAQVLPVYLSIQNPYIAGESRVTPAMLRQYKKELIASNQHMSDERVEQWSESKLPRFTDGRLPDANALNGDGDAMQRILKAGRYDGFKDGRHWVAFDSSQVKSATGNIGTYDITNPDIRKSLRSQQDQEIIDAGKERQELYDQFSPDLQSKLQKLIKADQDAEGILVGRYEGKEQQRLKSIAGRALRSYEKAFDAEFPGSDITAASVYSFVNRDGRFWNYDELIGEKKSLRAPNTKEFKQFFGRSKIVDKDGNPVPLYHATNKDFSIFKLSDDGKLGSGIYLSGVPEYAEAYALSGPVMPLWASVENPFVIQIPDANIRYEEAPFGGEYPKGRRYPYIFKVKPIEEAIAAFVKDWTNGKRRAMDLEGSQIRELFKDAGYDGIIVKDEEGNFIEVNVFDPTQIKSATGNIGTFDKTNPDIRKSLRAPDTKEFNDWFSDSKAVNKEGKAQVVYTGPARDVTEFEAGEPILTSPDPDVAALYSAKNIDKLLENAAAEMTEEQKEQAKADALALVEEEYADLDKKAANYKRRLEVKRDLIEDIKRRAFTKRAVSPKAARIIASAARAYMPVGENVMPVFLRATNPFDYENEKHVNMVFNHIERNVDFNSKVSEQAKEEARKLGVPSEFPEEKTKNVKSHLVQGLKKRIVDDKNVQRAIRALGFDSFYFKDQGTKNLGVFSSVQVKSVTGNIGTYGLNEPDIRKSMRSKGPDVPERLQRVVNEKVAVRDEESWLKRLMSAIVPSESDAFRQAVFNRYQRIGTKEKKAAQKDSLDQYTADVSAEFAALHSDYAAELMASAMGAHDGKGGIPVFRNGVTMIWNDNGNITGPLDIFQPLAKLGDKAFQHWQFWKSAQRGERLDRVNGKPTQFGKDDLQAAKELEALYPPGLFQEVDKAWDKYNRGLVNYMIDTGVISRGMGEEWMKHSDYFPFYRQQMDEDAKGPKMFSAISGVKAPKELKGGDITVGDFFENIIRNTQSAIEAGMKNIAAERAIRNELSLGDAKEIVGFKGEPKRPQSMTNVVTVLRNGETHYYECRDKLFVEAMKGLNMAEIPGLWLFSAPANLLRSFVTKTPDFILANLLRDSMSAWVTSGANITPIIDTAKGFGAAMAGTDPDMQMLYNFGLIGGHEFSGKARESGRTLAKRMRKQAGVKTKGEQLLTPVTAVWEALEKGSTASDAATRLAVYKNVLEETGNQAEALKRAMEIMNFQRKGNSALMRILAAAVPFLNARIQGLDVFYRAGIKPFVDPSNASEYEKQVAKAFIKRGSLMMAMSVLYYMMVRDDEDYLAQEEEVRDNNWIIPGLGVKIPIPFEVGIVFKTIPERITALMLGNDTGAQFMDSMARNVQSTFGLQLPQAVLPVIEVATGYSFYTHRQITPQGLGDVNKEYQVAPGTSRLAEVIGQFTSFTTAAGKSFGLSPIEIDHLIKGYTGTMGTYFVDAADVLINANSDIKSPSKRFEQMPFIRRFALDPDARGNVTAYYELKNAVDEVVRTSNLLERTGRVENLVEYQIENMPMLASKDYVNDLYKTMKEFNDMKRQIRSSPLDPDDKRDMIRAVEQMENALTSQIKEYRKLIAQ